MHITLKVVFFHHWKAGEFTVHRQHILDKNCASNPQPTAKISLLFMIGSALQFILFIGYTAFLTIQSGIQNIKISRPIGSPDVFFFASKQPLCMCVIVLGGALGFFSLFFLHHFTKFIISQIFLPNKSFRTMKRSELLRVGGKIRPPVHKLVRDEGWSSS